MKILYFYQYFSTPSGSWGTRVYEFAKEWVQQGHEVTVVSSIYAKSDLTAERFLEDQIIDGIQVKVINIKIDNKQAFLGRIWTFVLYAVVSCWYAVRLPADVVITSSGPITVGLPGLCAKYLRNRKLVFEARDLWPEGAIELGILTNPVLKKLAYWFEVRCYKAAGLIVGLSPGIQQYIQKKVPEKKVISVTNSANIDLFAGYRKLPEETVLVPRKYAIYTGNIGAVNNSYMLYEAAKALCGLGRPDLKILLIGDGQQREELLAGAKKEKLENFIHFGLMPKTDLVPYVQNALVSLVPLKGSPVLNTSSPNKFFESLAAGVPVVQTTNGWMKDFLEANEVGFTVRPDDGRQLAELLIRLDADPMLIESMGSRSKIVARQNFDKNVLAQKMLDAIITFE